MKVLVTGAAKGIGRAIAVKFLDSGHEVTGIDILPASIEHAAYTHFVTDILSGGLPETDGFEIIVHSAGVQSSGHDIDINLKGTLRVNERYAFQKKIRSVLFIASASASTGSEFPEYAASKGGMVAYMKNVAQRLAGFKATSNSLSPGGVYTDINDHIIKDPALMQAVLDEALLGKWASAEEIAEWAYFVTVVNQSMTAQDLLIDNGEAAKFNFIW